MSFFSSFEVYVARLRPLRALMASPQNCKQLNRIASSGLNWGMQMMCDQPPALVA
jgi:hypothetical protein